MPDVLERATLLVDFVAERLGDTPDTKVLREMPPTQAVGTLNICKKCGRYLMDDNDVIRVLTEKDNPAEMLDVFVSVMREHKKSCPANDNTNIRYGVLSRTMNAVVTVIYWSAIIGVPVTVFSFGVLDFIEKTGMVGGFLLVLWGLFFYTETKKK